MPSPAPAAVSPGCASHVRLALGALEGTHQKAVGAGARDVPVSAYLAPERAVLEARLFAASPALVAHESELARPGDCRPIRVGGVAALLVRGPDGALRAFRNACRHRASELVAGERDCAKKAFTCPYHGWTYDLRGDLIHVPREEDFPGLDKKRRGLGAIHVASRHGLVWAATRPFDPAEPLGEVDGDFAELGLESHVVWKRTRRVVTANWKLLIDAFLEAYHLRHLHRDSIYPFFLDARFAAERAGPHVRAVTARRALANARATDVDRATVRGLATPSYVLFPGLVAIFHPDYVSLLSLAPDGAGRTLAEHVMLVPAERAGEEAHWARAFAIIDEGVLAREDFAAVKRIQRGLAATDAPAVTFGASEEAAAWFHDALEVALTKLD